MAASGHPTRRAMPDPAHLLFALIVGCEVVFWLVLLASLVVRYVLRREVISKRLLWCLPAVDVLLLAFTAMDLRAGTPATFAHGLAAAYVGFTLAFGSVLIGHTDAWFAHRFAAGPTPARASTGGWSLVRYDLALWLRCIAAWTVALTLIELLVAFVARDAAAEELRAWHKHAFGCVVLWFVFGPLWSLMFVRRRPVPTV
jgi:hypothetical protein